MGSIPGSIHGFDLSRRVAWPKINKVYNSRAFNVFLDLCVHHHNKFFLKGYGLRTNILLLLYLSDGQNILKVLVNHLQEDHSGCHERK